MEQAFHQPELRCLPQNVIEPEFFGHERGCLYRGHTKPGQIEPADGGTLFLDEIATLTLPLQTKLLRVLEHLPQQRLAQRVTGHEATVSEGGVRFDDELRELGVASLEAALRRSDAASRPQQDCFTLTPSG
jgi:Sigma-54 interaction domain